MNLVIKRTSGMLLALFDQDSGEFLPQQKRSELSIRSADFGMGEFTVTFVCGENGIPVQVDDCPFQPDMRSIHDGR